MKTREAGSQNGGKPPYPALTSSLHIRRFSDRQSADFLPDFSTSPTVSAPLSPATGTALQPHWNETGTRARQKWDDVLNFRRNSAADRPVRRSRIESWNLERSSGWSQRPHRVGRLARRARSGRRLPVFDAMGTPVKRYASCWQAPDSSSAGARSIAKPLDSPGCTCPHRCTIGAQRRPTQPRSLPFPPFPSLAPAQGRSTVRTSPKRS